MFCLKHTQLTPFLVSAYGRIQYYLRYVYDVVLEHSLAAVISSHMCFVCVCVCALFVVNIVRSVLCFVVLNNLLVSGKVTVLQSVLALI